MKSEYLTMLRSAIDDYLNILENVSLEPNEKLLDFEFEFLNDRKWCGFGESLVKCELRELTNLMNGWSVSLTRWHAWNLALEDKDEDTSWQLRSEFVDALAHECLLKPSSIRDTLTSVATNTLHQVRISVDESYTDYLDGDPTASNPRPRHLTRKQKEKRLAKISNFWPQSSEFIRKIKQINSSDYIQKTFNYRNLTSHSIGPRLGLGYTNTVTRSVVPAKKIKRTTSGFYEEVPVPGKMSVCYGFGGTSPLNLEAVRIANIEQFKIARSCFVEYRLFLETVVSTIEST